MLLTLILNKQSIDIAISTCVARRAGVSLIFGSFLINFFRGCINDFYIIFLEFAHSHFNHVINVLLFRLNVGEHRYKLKTIK